MARPHFRFLPNVALADIAFEAEADTLEELFATCAQALTAVMVDRRTVRSVVKKELELKADDSDGLLYDFLTQLIVLKDVDSLLFRRFIVRLGEGGKSLKCTLLGEPIDRERQIPQERRQGGHHAHVRHTAGEVRVVGDDHRAGHLG